MFGTLKPHACHLGDAPRDQWRRLYCGTCKSLGDHFGQPHRALLSHDAVLLAALVDALQETPAPHASCRCPLMPIQHRPTLEPESVSMRYAAAVQVLLADQLLADRAMDGGRLARAARPLLSTPVATAHGELAELGLSLEALQGFELQQARVERPGLTTPAQAAAPTAGALAHVFGQLGQLPGVTPQARTEDARRELALMGKAIGESIYLIDALEDLRKDALGGAFNPCLGRRPSGMSPDPARVEEACDLLQRALATIRAGLDRLPLQRHRALLDNILQDNLGARARAASRQARLWASERGVIEMEAWRSRPAPARLMLQLASVALFVWTWLQAQGTALAQKAGDSARKSRRRRGREKDDSSTTTETSRKDGEAPPEKSDQSTETPGDGDAPGADAPSDATDAADGAPRLPDGDDPVTGTGNHGEGDDFGLGTGDGGGDGGGGGDGLGDPCGCSDAIGALFKGCGDAFKGCCDGFTEPCKDCCGLCNDCNKCCDGCKSGGDCCGPCNDCGNCCNGCNDCGNCCQGCNNCNTTCEPPPM